MGEINVKFDPEDMLEIKAYVNRQVAAAVREIKAEIEKGQAELRGVLMGVQQYRELPAREPSLSAPGD